MPRGAADIEERNRRLEKPAHAFVDLVLKGEVRFKKFPRRAYFPKTWSVVRPVFFPRVVALCDGGSLEVYEAAFDASQYIAFNVISQALSNDRCARRAADTARRNRDFSLHAYHTFIPRDSLQEQHRMKICCILQRRFAYVGHELVRRLKDEHGIRDFCAFVQTRPSYEFLSSQKDVLYSALLLDEDVQRLYKEEKLDLPYLQWLEQEYGMPNLWPYINTDRIIRFSQLVREYPYDTPRYTHGEMLRMVQVYAKAIIAFLDAEKPDVLFSAPIGAMSTTLLYHIAKKRGIRTLVMSFTGVRNRIALSETYDRLTFVEEIVRRDRHTRLERIPHFSEARTYIDEFRARPQVYSEIHEVTRRKFTRKQHFDFLRPSRLARMFRFAGALWKEWLVNPQRREDYSYIHPLSYVTDGIKRKMRNFIGLNNLYDTFDPSAPYAFFPLHLEPELSLLWLARFDMDQIAVVRRIAQSLPVGMKLVVKEHPQMVALRPRRFYRELKKIPNVVLIRPELSSFEVIAKAALVTTITGTAGWEASLMGKPVISFGDIFYNALPSVIRSRTPEELPTQVMRQLSPDFSFDDEALTRFVAALFEDSAETDILNIWELGGNEQTRSTELSALANLIAKKCEA